MSHLKKLKLTKFDDVTSELVPLERCVVVDINLPEELYEIFHQPYSISCTRQMYEHDFDELLHWKAIFLLHEIFFDLLELPVIQMAHDIVVFVVPVKVFIKF